MLYADYGSSLNGMSEEEQMRIAIEESMRDFAQANYLPDPEEEEEERYYTKASGSRITEQTQHNKGGDLIKQCSAIVYESCLQNGLDNGDPLEKATGENTAEDFVACRSKYFTKQEKCSVCDKTKDKDVSMDGECKCVTDATDCNGNEVGSGKSPVQLNGGSSQQDGFVPKLSSENDFKSMFDDDDFDKGTYKHMFRPLLACQSCIQFVSQNAFDYISILKTSVSMIFSLRIGQY